MGGICFTAPHRWSVGCLVIICTLIGWWVGHDDGCYRPAVDAVVHTGLAGRYRPHRLAHQERLWRLVGGLACVLVAIEPVTVGTGHRSIGVQTTGRRLNRKHRSLHVNQNCEYYIDRPDSDLA